MTGASHVNVPRECDLSRSRAGSFTAEPTCAREDSPQGLLLIWLVASGVQGVQLLCLILTRGYTITQPKTLLPQLREEEYANPASANTLVSYGLPLPNLARADFQHSC